MRVQLDRYLVDTLMPDLVGHDKQPSAFLVLLYLWVRSKRSLPGRTIRASLLDIALGTGLSKSAVQQALRTLRRRRLIDSRQASATSVPEYSLATPWRR